MNIAIDLLWVKHQQVGGIESYVRNLLDGFLTLSNDFVFTLLVSRDNKESFHNYSRDKRVKIVECPVTSTKLLLTVIWENLEMDRLVTGLSVDFCFVPYYRCPILPVKNKYLTVLHDLNALHFPQYFSKGKFYWLKYYWKYSLRNAYKIVAISTFVKNDIIDKYNVDVNKIDVSFESSKGVLDVCKNGAGIPFSEEKAKEILLENEIDILVNLNDGDVDSVAWGCDLTYDYVKINGDYRT